jgi:hypothetical protein
MDNSNELNRYIEYLQHQLVNSGTEVLANSEREWFAANRERLGQQLQQMAEESPAKESFSRLERSLVGFEPSTSYDSFHARQIFLPLVEKVSGYMREAGISLKSEVIFANSPAVEPNAFARPSANTHILFVGRGTSAFCNYWAKVFSEVIAALNNPELEFNKRLDFLDAERILTSSAVGELALRLTAYYAISGTVIGFGKVEQSQINHPTRAALLNAMELFIVAHELHHFVAEEEYPETGGVSAGGTAKDLEIACDLFGLSMCTGYGAEQKNPFAFLCIGPQLLFWALKTCEDARLKVLGLEREPAVTHPTLDERIGLIPEFISDVARTDTRQSYLETVAEAHNMATATYSFIMKHLDEIQDLRSWQPRGGAEKNDNSRSR